MHNIDSFQYYQKMHYNSFCSNKPTDFDPPILLH